jgi:very-short-patch-repair endonuclease
MSGMYYGASASIFRNAEKLRKNMTAAEVKLWKSLSNKQLNGFRFKNQHPISKFVVDFYCHKAKLVIELDGAVHNEKEQADYDIGRTYEIESFGLTIIRFTNHQIENDFEHVLKEIQKRLLEESPLQGI